jgi:hypothetical protein
MIRGSKDSSDMLSKKCNVDKKYRGGRYNHVDIVHQIEQKIFKEFTKGPVLKQE